MTQPQLKHQLMNLAVKIQFLQDHDQLETLIDQSLPGLLQAARCTDDLLDEKEVVALWSCFSTQQLRLMRTRNTGPKYLKLGSHRNSRIFYRRRDVQAWLDQHLQTPPS